MSKNIAGRKHEMQVLSDALNSYRSELIAVYGRRRIGKTYLIREYFNKKIVFSFTGLSTGKRPEQIKNFILKLNEITNKFTGQRQPVDWLEAFSLLKVFLKDIKETKKKKSDFYR